MKAYLCIVFIASVTAFTQNARVGGAHGKALLTVPMIGSGTWEDPKRPALVREAGVPFQYQISDDGKTAIVEVSPRNLAEIAKLDLLVQKEPRARLYRPDKDPLARVVGELKALKKDFDGASLAFPGPGTIKPAPGVVPAN